MPFEEVIEGYFLPRRPILVFPTNDGQVCVFLQWPRAAFRSVRADVEGHVWAAVAQVPRLAGRLDLAGGRRRRRRGRAAELFPDPLGPGWALAGNARLSRRNPLTGQGISDAFRDAQFLSGPSTPPWPAADSSPGHWRATGSGGTRRPPRCMS